MASLTDFRRVAGEVSNWGRWGDTDELGTLNFITPDKVAEAAGLVKHGKVFPLGVDFGSTGPQGSFKFRHNPIHVMTVDGGDAHSLPKFGPDWSANPGAQEMGKYFQGDLFRFNDDMIIMPLQCATQWDALSHVYYEEKLYNGFPADSVTSFGAPYCGIDKVDSKGITSRGVLLDVVRHRGVQTFLELGNPVSAAELDDVARAQGVTISRGDIVLVRTGWWARFSETGNGSEPGSGLDWQCASWLHDHDIAAVAADNLDGRRSDIRRGGDAAADAHAVPAGHGADARGVLGSQRTGGGLCGRRSVRVSAHRAAPAIHRRGGLSGEPHRDQVGASMEIHSRATVIDGLATHYLEAGHGDPVILLHGGEFGVSAEIGWEATIPALAERYRVLAPDMLGFGRSAKVIDFNDGRSDADPAHRPVLRRARCRLGALRRQLDGCDQPARRRHL